MDEFPLGSIKDYLWTNDNLWLLKNLLKQTVHTILQVSKETGFVHGDLHSANVMITNRYMIYYPIIIDLEKGMFVNNEEINNHAIIDKDYNDYIFKGLDKLEKLVAYDLIRLFHPFGQVPSTIQAGLSLTNLDK